MSGNRAGLALAALLMVPALASAQDRPLNGWEGRGFISASVGVQSASPNFGYNYATTLFDEQAKAGLQIPGKKGASFDVGGGVRLVQNFGVGFTYSRYSKSRTATLITTIPSPIVYGDSATIERQIPLQRDEDAFHIQAIYKVPLTSRLQAGVFGGPSYFRCLDDSVVSFGLEGNFSDQLDWLVAFRNVTQTIQKDSTWGYHGGADLTFMATPHIGVGATVRYSHAQHKTTNPLSDVSQLEWSGVWGGSDPTTTVTMRHGGVQWHGGMTFRF